MLYTTRENIKDPKPKPPLIIPLTVPLLLGKY